MEADWEFEVGGGAPVIDACWPGLIDLRRAPERASELPETAQLPALAEVLARLNAADSPVWSAKCDFWPRLEAGEFDLDEMAAPPGCAAHAMGCYIDLLPRSGQQWLSPDKAAAWCKCVCGLLRAVPRCCCRADLVIRRAILTADSGLELGVTTYLTSCGTTSAEAAQALAAALAAFADAVCGRSKVE
jgi:hypothetical protein